MKFGQQFEATNFGLSRRPKVVELPPCDEFPVLELLEEDVNPEGCRAGRATVVHWFVELIAPELTKSLGVIRFRRNKSPSASLVGRGGFAARPGEAGKNFAWRMREVGFEVAGVLLVKKSENTVKEAFG